MSSEIGQSSDLREGYKDTQADFTNYLKKHLNMDAANAKILESLKEEQALRE